MKTLQHYSNNILQNEHVMLIFNFGNHTGKVCGNIDGKMAKIYIQRFSDDIS